MNILIFIEHNVIIRHFIHSNIFKELTQTHSVHFVFPQVGYKRVKDTDFNQLDLNAPYLHLNVHQERLKIWQKLFKVSWLRWQPGKHYAIMRKFQRLTLSSFQTEWSQLAREYTRLALPIVYSIFRRKQLQILKRIPNRDLHHIINTYKPDILIHPCVLSGVYIDDLIVTARETSIPLITIMNSWDNPSTKYSAYSVPDWLLVWGEQTKKDAVKYMKMTPKRIIKFGVAQFDIYRSKPRITREEFCQRHDINPQAKILLYAGSSKGSDEFSHLVVIEKAIDLKILENVIVVYRPHPWGDAGKEGHRILDYPWKYVRLESTMLDYMQRIKVGDKRMSYPDYRDTHDVLSSIDALISPLSTIILEGALHGKPVMCYMTDDEEGAQHFRLVAPMVFFNDLLSCPEVVVGRGCEELIPKLVQLIARIEEKGVSDRLKKAMEYFIEPFEESYGQRLVKFVEQVYKTNSQ